MPAGDPTHCRACRRELGYRRVLCGWHPCHCGGHRTWRCEGKGACGHTEARPPVVEGCAGYKPPQARRRAAGASTAVTDRIADGGPEVVPAQPGQGG